MVRAALPFALSRGLVGDDGGDGHAPFESPSDERSHQYEEHEQSVDGLLGDALAPRGTHRGGGHIGCGDSNFLGECFLHLGTCGVGLVGHLHLEHTSGGVTGTDLDLGVGSVETVVVEHLACLRLGHRGGRHGPDHTAREVEAAIQTSGEERNDADEQQCCGDTEADVATTVEVDGSLAVVQATAGATPGMPGGRIEIDANGILQVSAQDKATAKLEKITITADKGRLSQEDIERMIKEAEEFAEEDKKTQGRINAKNGLESYLYNLKNTLNDEKFTDKIDASEKNELVSQVDEALDRLEENPEADAEAFTDKQKEVEKVANPILLL